MKRFILFVLLISVLGFMLDAKEETTQQERIVKLNVSEDCKLEIDSLDRDIATITEHEGEYYVYTANKVNVYPPNDTKFANKRLTIEEPGKGGLFFKRSKPSEVANVTNPSLSFNKNYIIGYDTGSFPRVKFSVAGKVFYLCRPEYHRIDSTKLLIDTVGFHQNKVKVIKDTLSFSKKDTLHTITIIEPKHAVFMSCAYNGKELFPNKLSFPVKEFNDLQRIDSYSLEIPSNIWEQFATGGNLYVRMAVLDETGAFDAEYIQTYHIKVEEQDQPILTYVLIAVAVLLVLTIIVFVIVRRRKRHNKSNVKTDIKEDTPKVVNVETEVTETPEVATNADAPVDTTLEDQLKQKDIIISVYLDEIERLKGELEDLKASKEKKDNLISELTDEVKGQSEKINVLTIKCNDYEKKVKDQENTIKADKENIKKQDEIIVSLENEHKQEITDLKKDHEYECGRFMTEINDLQSKIAALTSSWADDKKGVVNFFTRYVENLDQTVNVVLNDADPDSQAYMEISQLADSMNGYLVFKNKAVEILAETTRPINQVEKLLVELLITDMNYEKSWVNTIARLYAYSQVPELESIFGYYDSNAVDIKRLFRSLENLTELFGVSDLQVPVLFRDEFTSKKFEYKNTNLVIPQLYPEYVELLKPMVVYDFSRVGYTYVGEIVKPIVAYNTNN